MIDKEILDAVIPVPTLDELRNEKIAELKDEGFVVTNFHSGGVFYTTLMVVLRIKIELLQLARRVLNNMFVSHAGGVWLDLKAADYSKKRKKAQKTQGLVTVSRMGADGEAVKIAKGHVFKSIMDINGEELRYFTTDAAVLQKGVHSVDVLVEAEAEGSRYNVPEGQITRTLTYIGEVTISNGADWIVREGSDTEDDESVRTRALRSWSELAQLATEDAFINAAESVAGVLFAQADCDHPRGQGTVDVIVTGTAGEATEGLLAEVTEAVDKIAGPYDNILVKSSVTVAQNIEVTVTTSAADADEDIETRVKTILTELLAVRRGRKLYELTRSDINHAIRSGYSASTNAEVITPAQDVKLEKDKVIALGAVTVTVRRE
nr:MAG TPA: Baseplate J like protein [Caudoviricetes sp.]